MSDSPDKRPTDQRIGKAWRRDVAANEQPEKAPSAGFSVGERALTPEERERRRRSLLSVLAASEARQQKARRKRLPALVPGLVVAIKTGDLAGKRGTVCDADYIHGRALLQIDDESTACWVSFIHLAPLGDDPLDPQTAERRE